jgi:hypothetical protein
MAQTWKYALGLGLLNAVLAVGCTVSSGDDDSFAGASGEGASGGSGGSGGSKGGSAGKGGSGGSAGAKGGTGGTAGAPEAGSGGSTAGTGGSTGGTGEAGAGGMPEAGTSGTGPTAMCDPTNGNDLPSKDSDSCAPVEGATGDDLKCQECMQTHCCAETKTCYGETPYNVCGWGGPTDGDYAGYNEIGCYIACLRDLVAKNDMTCDAESEDACGSTCATTMCIGDGVPLIGNATMALTTCMQQDCSLDCFGADTCD